MHTKQRRNALSTYFPANWNKCVTLNCSLFQSLTHAMTWLLLAAGREDRARKCSGSRVRITCEQAVPGDICLAARPATNRQRQRQHWHRERQQFSFSCRAPNTTCTSSPSRADDRDDAGSHAPRKRATTEQAHRDRAGLHSNNPIERYLPRGAY